MASTHEDSAMSDFAASHKRHLEYTYRLPTPPRIVVPPPTLTTDMPNLNIGSASAEEIDTSFLKELNLEDIVQKNTLLEWSYERRRHAQMILPWLYLGPMVAAKDREFLAREGITMIMAVRAQENSMKGVVQSAREVCHEVVTVEAANFHMLIGKFTDTTRMINRHVAKIRSHTAITGKPQLGKVLVFCESGNEKSAAVVAAYLMETLDDFDYIKSMQVCQAQRFCVNFDDTVKNILRSHWDIIQARRSVASSRAALLNSSGLISGLQQVAQHLQTPNQTTKSKRSIEDLREDEDIDMADGADPSDLLRFTGRDITPFQDH